ncbi:MAG: Ig-like domain-containing protein [archaeon]
MHSKNMFIRILLITGIFIISIITVVSAPGTYCIDNSPCICGSNCSGGYEEGNDYNTLDGHLPSGCWDGADSNFEYTNDVNATDLERSIFVGGDTVRITATSVCDGSGDYVSFSYYNGTRWRRLNYTYCTYSGIIDFSIDFTLDNIEANHAVRVSTFWAGQTTESCAATSVCGYTCEPVYSDTDDVMFFVHQRETNNPTVTILSPAAGAQTMFSQGYKINISASASDENSITQVSANIIWPENSLTLILNNENGIYSGNFSNATYLGRYNITIIAEDTYGNINNSQTTYFILNSSVNITLQSPVSGGYYQSASDLPLIFTVQDDYPLDTIRYSLNGITKDADFGKGIINNQSGSLLINNTAFYNLSQSFNFSEDLSVRRIGFYLKKAGTPQFSFAIASDNDGPNTILGNGSISGQDLPGSAGLVLGYLETAVSLTANTTYWIIITSGGNTTDYVEWQTNPDIYVKGNSYYNGSHNTSWDFLFKLQDENRFNTTITAATGQNSLTIYKNNTLGVSQQKSIEFYIDSISPSITNISFFSRLEFGSKQEFHLQAIDNYVINSGVIEYSGSNHTMNFVNSTFLNFTFIPSAVAEVSFKIFVNDSAGNRNISNTYSFFVNDTLPPFVRKINITPSDPDGLDPNVTIEVSANMSDYSAIDKVMLQYKMQSDSSWNTLSMSNDSGIYKGNFTPTAESVYIYRTLSNDTYGNFNYSMNYSVNISFDRTWSVLPTTFGVNSSAIGTSKIIGDIMINNSGDFDFDINISNSGTPAIGFNTTFPVTVPAGNAARVNVNATSPIVSSSYLIIFSVADITNGRTSNLNLTLVAYESGPYLYLETPIFDSSAEQGEHINQISLKTTNLGNDTSYNTTARWTLPASITSRNNLSYSIGDLGVGQSAFFNISADVSSSATVGDTTILGSVNNSAGNYYSISRTISITEKTVESSPAPASSSSSSSSTRIVNAAGNRENLNQTYDLILSATSFEIPRNSRKEITIGLKNEMDVNLSDIALSLEGLYSNYYIIEPGKISKIPGNSVAQIRITFSLPSYMEEGKKEIYLVIGIDRTIIRKKIELVIVDATDALTDCTEQMKADIDILKEKNIGTENLEKMLAEISDAIAKKDYIIAEETCKLSQTRILSARETSDRILGSVSKLQGLKKTDADKFSESILLAKDLLSKGEYEKAKAVMDQIDLLISVAPNLEKPIIFRIWQIVTTHLIEIAMALPIIFLLSLIIRQQAYLVYKKNTLAGLKEEESEIKNLIGEVQEDYYVDKVISRNLYDQHMKAYSQQHAQLRYKKMMLEIKKSAWEDKRDLSSIKNLLFEEIKNLQYEYYDQKHIDGDTYERLFSEYEKLLSGINEKIENGSDNIVIKNKKMKTDAGKKEMTMPKKHYFTIPKISLFKKKVYPLALVKPANYAVEKVEEKMLPAVRPDITKMCQSQSEFILNDGRHIKSILELLILLQDMQPDVFRCHINQDKNDFASWINDVFRETVLSMELRGVYNKEEMIALIRSYFER